MAYWQCSACGQVSEAFTSDCPNCGGLDTFLEKEGEIEPERLSVEQTEDGARERTPEEVRQEVAADLAETGGQPQRPIP